MGGPSPPNSRTMPVSAHTLLRSGPSHWGQSSPQADGAKAAARHSAAVKLPSSNRRFIVESRRGTLGDIRRRRPHITGLPEKRTEMALALAEPFRARQDKGAPRKGRAPFLHLGRRMDPTAADAHGPGAGLARLRLIGESCDASRPPASRRASCRLPWRAAQ